MNTFMNYKDNGKDMFNKFLAFISLILILTVSTQVLTAASAVRSLSGNKSRADYSAQTYEEYATDMSVKVLGGYVNLKRKYSSKGWELNPNWKNLTFQNLTGTELDIANYVSIDNGGNGSELPADESEFVAPIGKILRDRYEYSPVSTTTRDRFIDRFDPSLELFRIDTGYRWQNRMGDWIEYNHLGVSTAYGDKNNIRVSFVRDTEGRIIEVKDHFDTTVLSYDYSVADKITVSDYDGRTVIYSGNFRFLPKVTDVRGNDWLFEYQNISFGKSSINVLTKKIDPEGRETIIGHEAVKGGAVTFSGGGAGTAATWNVEEYTDPDTGVAGVRETLSNGGSSGTPAFSVFVNEQVMFTNKVYDDGAKEEYRYFYNPDTKTTALITTNTDGLYIDQWFGEDGKAKRLASGGLVLFTRAASQNDSYFITVDTKGRKTRTENNIYEQAVRIEHPDGTEVSYKYHPKYSFVTEFTDENGDVTKIDYDANGNAEKITAAFGKPEARVIEYDYDQYGRPTVIRQVGDASTATSETIVAYDNFGNVTQITDPENHITKYQDYDSLGMSKTLIDARGKTWTYVYDAQGNQTKLTTPLGFETVLTYDKVSNLRSVLDSESNLTQFDYDARDRLSTTTNALGDKFTVKYAIDGLPISAVNEEGHTATFTYDRQRRIKSAINEESLGVEYNYEDEDISALSRIDEIVTPNGNIKFTLDKRGRVLTQTSASVDESILLPTSYIYDNQFNVLEATDAESNVSKNTYSAHDELTTALNANSESTSLNYDRRGNLKVVTDPKATTTTYEYDKRDLVVKEIKHMGQSMSYAYDPSGNLLRITDSKGQIISFVYDDDGRLITEQHFLNSSIADDPDGVASKTITYSYNTEGYLTGYNDGETSAVYVLDKLYRLDTATVNYGAFTKTYGYTYAKDDQVESFTNAEAVVSAFGYDKANRLNLIQISDQGSIAVSEHNGNLPSKIVYPGGVTVTVDYDGVGRVVLEDVRDPAGNLLQITSYAYDAVSNVKTKTAEYTSPDSNSSFSYEYDPVYRLLEAEQSSTLVSNALVDRSYRYDEIGNRIATEASLSDGQEEEWIYNANHELERINRGGDGGTDVLYTYDANGSTISKTVGDNTETYIYDLENRLREVKQNEITVAKYYYDPFGQRLWKEVNGSKTYFLYANEGLVAEYNATGELSNSFMYVPDGFWSTEALGQITGGEAYFYQHDQIGMPNLMTSKSGEVKWQGTADAYGRMNVSVNDLPSNVRFPGQYEDSETGLNQNFKRDYDPATGRYIQSDPIGLAGGLNRYSYSGNNPINAFDPTGENFILKFGGKKTLQFGKAAAGFAGTMYMRCVKECLAFGGITMSAAAAIAHYWVGCDVDASLLVNGGAAIIAGCATGCLRPWNWIGLKNKSVIPKKKGRLKIDSEHGVKQKHTQSEKNVAWALAGQGRNVHLRHPKGTRAGGATSDLIVDGVPHEIYTPKTTNIDRIVGGIGKKGSQAKHIVLDLSQTSVTRDQLGNLLERVKGSGSSVVDIIILDFK